MESSSSHCRGEVTSCWRPCASRSKPCAHLQRPQESNQVRLLLIRQAQPEADIVEVDRVEECRGRAVVEVRGATGEAAQDGTLEAADVLPFAGDECPARVGHVLDVAGRLVAQPVGRHVADGKAEPVMYTVTACGNGDGRIGDPNIQRGWHRMVTGVRRVVARRAETEDGSVEALLEKTTEDVIDSG